MKTSVTTYRTTQYNPENKNVKPEMTFSTRLQQAFNVANVWGYPAQRGPNSDQIMGWMSGKSCLDSRQLARNLSPLKSVHPHLQSIQSSIQGVTETLSPLVNRFRRAADHFYQAPRLGMGEAIPPLPPHASMAFTRKYLPFHFTLSTICVNGARGRQRGTEISTHYEYETAD